MPVHELTADRPLAPAPARTSLTVPRRVPRHSAAIVVLTLAGLSFLLPSAPTYDPWAWIVWGREILHLDLSTVEGPSWKPLPILLTTPFALTGPLAPDLWLFVARAGALGGVVLAFRLARRLGGGLPGGLAAAAAYAFAPWTIRNAALGNSEGLLVALLLGALERHLAGQRATAFALGLGAALLRPEAWPFLGLYGLWLFVREPAARRLVAAGFVALPGLWLLPELWGSGDLLRAMHRAQTPRADSAAFAEDPALRVLEQFNAMLNPVIYGGLALLAAVLLLRRAPSRTQALAAGGVLVVAVIWVAEVTFMTSDGGFSGNVRYLIAPAALVIVLAGTGAGWAVRLLAERRGELPVGVAAALALALAVGFALPSRARFAPTLDSVGYQARMTDELSGVVERAGGKQALLACGRPFTGPFQVPSVAWYLGVHTTAVQLVPVTPAVVFRARNAGGGRPGPDLASVGGEDGVRTLATSDRWRIVATCDPRAGTA